MLISTIGKISYTYYKRRCDKSSILLLSNHHPHVGIDLLLKQQSHKIKTSLKEINTKLYSYHLHGKTLFSSTQQLLKSELLHLSRNLNGLRGNQFQKFLNSNPLFVNHQNKKVLQTTFKKNWWREKTPIHDFDKFSTALTNWQ